MKIIQPPEKEYDIQEIFLTLNSKIIKNTHSSHFYIKKKDCIV